jgi:hypothetical protein
VGTEESPRARQEGSQMPQTAVTWEDPPPPRKRYDWDSIAQQLRERPGEWAKIFDYDRTSLAVAIRTHGIKALDPDLGFEVRTANNVRGTPRTCTMYLRFNPEKVKN